MLADDIDLLNVSFDGRSAPDRISARAGVSELRRIAPSRKYSLNFSCESMSMFNALAQHVYKIIYFWIICSTLKCSLMCFSKKITLCDWKCRWKLVEINAELSTLTFETKHVMSLINPANTYMVLNFILWPSVDYICPGHVSC